MLEIHEGAIFVADAHYASYRPLFKKLIDQLESGELTAPQLFLMGDVFDLLMGPIKTFTLAEQEIVTQLQSLSQKMEIIYFEGNHDFQLKTIFPDMTIFPLAMQPLPACYNQTQGYLAHGDWNEGGLYSVYSWVIRSRFVLYTLAFLDQLMLHKITHWFRAKMQAKKLCREFNGFQAYITEKFKRHEAYEGWFIEGHYHQGESFWIDGLFYHNLSSMACNKSYFVVQSSNNAISLASRTL